MKDYSTGDYLLTHPNGVGLKLSRSMTFTTTSAIAPFKHLTSSVFFSKAAAIAFFKVISMALMAFSTGDIAFDTDVSTVTADVVIVFGATIPSVPGSARKSPSSGLHNLQPPPPGMIQPHEGLTVGARVGLRVAVSLRPLGAFTGVPAERDSNFRTLTISVSDFGLQRKVVNA